MNFENLSPADIPVLCEKLNNSELADLSEYINKFEWQINWGCQDLEKYVVPEMARRLRNIEKYKKEKLKGAQGYLKYKANCDDSCYSCMGEGCSRCAGTGKRK